MTTPEELAKYTPEQLTEYQTISPQAMYDELLAARADNLDLRRRLRKLNEEIDTGTKYKYMVPVLLIISYALAAAMYEVGVMQWRLDQLSYMIGFIMFGLIALTQTAVVFIWRLVKAIRVDM